MKRDATVTFGGAVTLIAVAGLAYWLGARTGHAPEAPAGAASTERKIEFWYDPMNPTVHFDAPGKSPFMDMQLVPKYADTADSGTVRVDPRMVQNLGMRTALVTRADFHRSVRAVGRVEVDERSIHRVTVRAEGWVESLPVRAAGARVGRGELLARLYSPEFDTAQREFLLARKSGDATLVTAARARLTALAVGPEQIAALERTGAPQPGIDVHSPVDGYVMQLNTRQGAAATRDAVLFEIAAHMPIWIVADIPEASAAWIEPGAHAVATTVAHPGRSFVGTVDYVYPVLDDTTRARRARIVLPNADDALHPGMYAAVTIDGGRLADVVQVPSEALIRTGTRTVAIVAEADGRYRPVEVDAGDEANGSTVVRSGLSNGDRVVVSGQFLIDSEANLRGIAARSQEPNDSTQARP